MVLLNKIKEQFFWVPSILMIIDAILKFFHISLWIDFPKEYIQDKLSWMGIIELCCLAVFLLPKIQLPGYFLLCCYWGAEIVIGFVNTSFYLFPIAMLTLFIVAAYWRNCSDNPRSIKLNTDNLNQ